MIKTFRRIPKRLSFVHLIYIYIYIFRYIYIYIYIFIYIYIYRNYARIDDKNFQKNSKASFFCSSYIHLYIYI